MHFPEYNNWILLRQVEKSGKRKRCLCVRKKAQPGGGVCSAWALCVPRVGEEKVPVSASVRFSGKGGDRKSVV